MKASLRWLISAAVLLAVAGCATFIPVRVMKPARLNITGIKKVAILDFEFTGSWSFWQDDKDITFEGIAKQALIKQLGLAGGSEKAAPPDPKTAYPGREFSAKFIAGLVENGHYEVLEREQIQKILDEHKLNMSGMVDESQAAQIGKMLGVDALIYGVGNYSVSDKGDWKEYSRTRKEKFKKPDGTTGTKNVTEKYKKFRATRSSSAQLSFRIINVETGVIIAAKNLTGGGSGYAERDEKVDAYTNLPDWRPLVDQAVNSMVNQAVVEIAPHQVVQRREIMGGKTPAMKRGMDYAKRGMMDEAREAWQDALGDNSKKGMKDRVAAMYNTGMYYELAGDLDKAEDMYEQCYKFSGKAKFLDHKARVKARKKELEVLESQQAE